MTSKNCPNHKKNEDNRAFWERPAVRRLATEYAQGDALLQSEGNCMPGGDHSGKNVVPPC